MSVIPGGSQMSKVARRRGDRRHSRHVGISMPGKKVSRSIDAIMRKPTLRRSDPASRVALAGVSSQHANTRCGGFVAALPRQTHTGTRGFTWSSVRSETRAASLWIRVDRDRPIEESETSRQTSPAGACRRNTSHSSSSRDRSRRQIAKRLPIRSTFGLVPARGCPVSYSNVKYSSWAGLSVTSPACGKGDRCKSR